MKSTRCRLWWILLSGLLSAPAWAQGPGQSPNAEPEDVDGQPNAADPVAEGVTGRDQSTPGASKETQGKGADAKEDDPPVIEFSGRVHGGWKIERLNEVPADGSDRTDNTFYIRRARLKATGRPTDWLRGVINIDATAIFELGSSILRDAYVHVEPLPQLELRLGQFKKPFSRIELRSSSKLHVIERGEGNELIVEDLSYGDRDLGLRASGRMLESIRLRYDVGVFNGSGPNYDDTDRSKDVVARVEARPAKWIRPGVNGSFKFFSDPAEGQPGNAWAVGGDVRFKGLGFELHLEGLVAEDHTAWLNHPNEPDFKSPLVVNAFGILSQRHDFNLSWGFALEPVVKIEFLDPDVDIVSDDVMLFTPGVNAYFGEYLRVMAQGELRSAQRNSSSGHVSRKTFTILACVDL